MIRRLIILLLIVGCAPIYYDYGSTIILTSDRVLFPEGYDGDFTYHSPEYQLIELEKSSKIELWTSEELNDKKAGISLGGYIVVKTAGITIGSAKVEYWDCKIEKLNGDEIDYRVVKDNYSIPNFIGDKWWDLFYIYINEPMNEPFKVYLIDRLSHKRTDWIVYPNEKVTTMPKS